jgi:hypothetical protein
MATGNVTVKIEGLEALEALIQQLNDAIDRIETMRPVYGDVHIAASYPDTEINLLNSRRA